MAGRFSSATVEQVRAASDIVDVIGGCLPLKRAGANFVTLCPFHKEKSPSFNVNPQRQIFHCFGCHKGGDVFTFLQEYENLTFTEALRRLADRAGLPLELDLDSGEAQAQSLKDTLRLIHEQITQRWYAVLTHDAAGAAARGYLARRGVPDEAITVFRLGFAPDAWDDTVNWAVSKGHDLALVEQAGLILRKEGESKFYDRFRGRLMFPIADEQGRVIGFSGRILDPEAKTAKYVNSPETPIFLKRRVFFGLDKTKRAILDARFAIICEGQLDLIRCFLAGVKNMVAPQGTALTADHARILKRYVDEVVLCFDSDLAGQKAAVRALDDLLSSGLAIRVATVPAPHDPDSFIREFGGDAFQKLIDAAAGFFDFYLNHLCATHDVAADKGRLAVLHAMGEAVKKTGNAVLIDKYAQATALRLSVSPNAVRAEFAKLRPAAARPKAADPAPVAPTTLPAPARPSPQEHWLLRLLFHPEADVAWTAAHLDLNWLHHPAVRRIVALRFAALGDAHWHGPGHLLDQLNDPAAASLLTELLLETRPIPNPVQQLGDILMRMRNAELDQALARISQEAGRPELSEAERRQLLERQQVLRNQKRQPLEPLPSPQG